MMQSSSSSSTSTSPLISFWVVTLVLLLGHAVVCSNNYHWNHQHHHHNNDVAANHQQKPYARFGHKNQMPGYEFTGLHWINRFRRLHQAPVMFLDTELAQRAQACALYYATRKTIDHSCRQKDGAGENFYMMFTSAAQSDATVRAIQAWYKESRLYKNYGREAYEVNTGTGHFSQVVWAESSKLGLGVAKVGSRTVVVGLFWPPGNFIGNFKDNVLPPLY